KCRVRRSSSTTRTFAARARGMRAGLSWTERVLQRDHLMFEPGDLLDCFCQLAGTGRVFELSGCRERARGPEGAERSLQAVRGLPQVFGVILRGLAYGSHLLRQILDEERD